MSTRDELAEALGREEFWRYEARGANYIDMFNPSTAADALIAEGWRKKPSREEIARAIASGLDGWNDYDAASIDYKRELLEGADAILALMDRGQ